LGKFRCGEEIENENENEKTLEKNSIRPQTPPQIMEGRESRSPHELFAKKSFVFSLLERRPSGSRTGTSFVITITGTSPSKRAIFLSSLLPPTPTAADPLLTKMLVRRLPAGVRADLQEGKKTALLH